MVSSFSSQSFAGRLTKVWFGIRVFSVYAGPALTYTAVARDLDSIAPLLLPTICASQKSRSKTTPTSTVGIIALLWKNHAVPRSLTILDLSASQTFHQNTSSLGYSKAWSYCVLVSYWLRPAPSFPAPKECDDRPSRLSSFDSFEIEP
jgi:hypothetical protein